MTNHKQLRALLADDPTPGYWEVGGPFPATSVICCIDFGSGGPDAEPPVYDCVCQIDIGIDGATEQNPTAVKIARLIVAARNALPDLLDEVDRLRKQLAEAADTRSLLESTLAQLEDAR